MTGQVIWITGLSGAGKTTLAEELNLRLQSRGLSPILLDGDLLRNIFITKSSGEHAFNRNSRINLGLKYGLLCKTLSVQGFTVIIATIAMFDEVYNWNRNNIKNYFEIYLKVPLEELYLRDNKKIYQQYRAGTLKNVAGLDLTVDEPLSSDAIYDFDYQSILWENPENLINQLMEEFEKKAIFF